MPKLWNVLIVVLAIALVYLLGRPQYIHSKKLAADYAVYSNMYTLKAAAENYAAYNEGAFPVSAEELKEYLSLLGEEIVNPYTKETIRFPVMEFSPEGDTTIEKGDIEIFVYEFREENREKHTDSKNGSLRGTPGGYAYGYYIPPGDSVAKAYGIIGFNKNGEPLSDKNPAGGVTIKVLINSD